eukprot:CAMPEP_0183317044 /NCGR_PEP_ID=MMETSP0160_2-20130417/56847_1 /TAXON_ID=2839 ORGANISM="Odontella Sinensis, Strain Grunow 1884" /NCGR_SAMPLE_ID=MMETSP0160_2 /ASSEMBLY_ACC=CAM_ASM_000250 /LENGTH=76 /DNA_ID=CAMNT_0025482987 /DNA_START=178 /DNA_END=404 /DNA_ORIENTATION=-
MKGFGPINIKDHMLRNSAVAPLSLAANPRPCTVGSSNAEDAMNDEHSMRDLPYSSGFMKGNMPPDTISSKNSLKSP